MLWVMSPPSYHQLVISCVFAGNDIGTEAMAWEEPNGGGRAGGIQQGAPPRDFVFVDSGRVSFGIGADGDLLLPR